MDFARWLREWPVYRQLTGDDRTGHGPAAMSARTRELRPRTATADRVVRSVCPYCAVDSPVSRGRLCPKGSASLHLTTGPGRRYEVMRRRLGFVAGPYRTGTGGRLMRSARALTTVGAVGGATVGRGSRVGALLSGLAPLAGSAATRFGVFQAGVDSTRDPKYVVRPQRERLSTMDGDSTMDGSG